MRRATVIVFLKAPRLGQVKTRLAKAVGELAALRFHRGMADRLIRALARDPRWRVVLALSPRAARHRRDIPCPSLRRIDQGNGDLGRRMAHVLGHAAPGPVLLVGTDVPELTPAVVATGFCRLAGNDAVLGPAEDGGFWLVGVRDRRLPHRAFAGVRWSTRHALADTLANLRDRRVALLAPLADIDTEADYARWRSRTR